MQVFVEPSKRKAHGLVEHTSAQGLLGTADIRSWMSLICRQGQLVSYLSNSHGSDFLNVNHAVMPGHQALHVDIQLVPQS